MKTILVICLMIAAATARPESIYDTRFDDFDAESLVGNVRLLKSYGNCFLSNESCTPEGSAYKKNIPDALITNNCSKCSPKQRHLMCVIVKGLWQQLVKKADPTGQYQENFKKFLNSSD